MTNVKIKGIEVEMGGAMRVVPPLNLRALEELQDELAGFSGGIDKKSTALIKKVALAALLRNYPDMTVEALAEELDVSNMGPIFEAVMDVSGLARARAEEEKKLKAAASLSGSIGTA